ncbi:MAG TPA: 2-C-methyl-D-erythritol 4-phosphate cytidylyltransferase [Chthoniobacterales bacterium]|nr:2-C-methyl-D-erythritol 4-phosphate cytidylyltransferase [Chthoniobacterales bacterium]
MLAAIIVAAGSSQRMGFDKLFASLNGEPVLVHSLRAFEETDAIREIVLVGRAERLAQLEGIVAAQAFTKVAAIIPGGARRQDSVRFGLERISAEADFVAVHDAARPLVRPDLIGQIYETAQRHGGAASGAPIVDTLKRVDGENVVVAAVEREKLFAVETPQIFRRDLLEQAFRKVFEADLEVTDEISAVEMTGARIVLVPNRDRNFKITYPSDLALAEFILRQRASSS